MGGMFVLLILGMGGGRNRVCTFVSPTLGMGGRGGGGVLISCIAVVLTLWTLASLQCRGGGGGIQFVHGRSRMTIDPRIPAMPRRDLTLLCVCTIEVALFCQASL